MYEIKILSNDDFDKLPYKRSTRALGLADAKAGKAYIRQTGDRMIDLNTINHEFDELLQKVSPHEEDGIRYKDSFGETFKNSFKYNPFTAWFANDKVREPGIKLASLVPSPVQPLATAASLALTARDISKRGFQPTDILSLAGPTLGAFKGISAAGPGALAKTIGGLKGSVGALGNAASTGSSLTTDALSSRDLTPLGANFGKGIQDFAADGIASGNRVSTLSSAIPEYIGRTAAGGKGALDAFKAGVQDVGKSLITKKLASSLTPSGAGAAQVYGQGSLGGSQGALDRFGGNLQSFDPNSVNPTYISDDDVFKAFEGIDLNTSRQSRQAQQQFRGQSREENTAYNELLNNIAQSRELERDQFVKEADTTNQSRYKTAVKNDIIKRNNLDEASFNKYLEQAKSPGANANLKSVFAAFL